MKTIFPTQWRGATEGSALSPTYLYNFFSNTVSEIIYIFKNERDRSFVYNDKYSCRTG